MILKFIRKFFIPILFLLFGSLIAFFILRNRGSENAVSDTRIINHEIQRLNKMIVIEQNYSAFRTKKYNDYNSRYLDFLNKNIVLYITAKAQITYDMKKMRIETDSINRKIHIISLPEPELNIYPNVEIYSMEDGFFNRFSKADLNRVMEEGKKDIRREVEKSNITSQAHAQLINNLNELYTIAQIYNWEIIDDTQYAKEVEALKY